MAAGDKMRLAVDKWATYHQMIPEQLDPVAELVRDTYVGFRRSAFPNYRPHLARHNITFWRHVATKVLEHKVDPRQYVSAAFKLFGARMYPEALLSEQIGRACTNPFSNEGEERSLETSIKLFAAKLNQRYAEGCKPLAELLTDIDICSCPVFVWCVAMKYKLYDVAEQYRQRADRRLLDPVYKTVYSRVFKEVFDGNNR